MVDSGCNGEPMNNAFASAEENAMCTKTRDGEHSRVGTSNIVMWDVQHNDADWEYFKILILQETWKIQNQHQVESYAFSEVTRSCQ